MRVYELDISKDGRCLPSQSFGANTRERGLLHESRQYFAKFSDGVYDVVIPPVFSYTVRFWSCCNIRSQMPEAICQESRLFEVIQPINCLRGWGHVICDYSCIILAWDLARVAELLQKAVAFFYA